MKILDFIGYTTLIDSSIKSSTAVASINYSLLLLISPLLLTFEIILISIFITLTLPFFSVAWILLLNLLFRLSFDQVRGYVKNNWISLTAPGQTMPAYIQLDHVYGLAGFDLNMTPVSAALSCMPTSLSFPVFSPSSSSSTSISSSSTSSSPSSVGSDYILTHGHNSCITSYQNTEISSMALSVLTSISIVPPVPNPTPIVQKKSFIHYMFPTKRPRFIVQR